LVYGVLRASVGLRLTQEQEFQGTDLSVHHFTTAQEVDSRW
jgi:Amt family ammonium transporter